MDDFRLVPPCSYQGGKQRLAKQIVELIGNPDNFYELCCGSAAVSLEMINQGYNPNNITLVDKGLFGVVYETIANNKFDIKIFENYINKLPKKPYIQEYLKNLSLQEINYDDLPYHYLLLQSGSFGGKQIWIENNQWKNNTFRSYWQPTTTSNRKSPVNPTQPETKTMLERTREIVKVCGGIIKAYNMDIKHYIKTQKIEYNSVVYIDPPYYKTTGYKFDFDLNYVINLLKGKTKKIIISYNLPLDAANKTILLSEGRKKGGISGNRKIKPNEEWLNIIED